MTKITEQNVEDLLNALSFWIRTEKKHDDALRNYAGMEWGYHGHDFIEERRDAVKSVTSAMNAIFEEDK